MFRTCLDNFVPQVFSEILKEAVPDFDSGYLEALNKWV